MTTRKSKSKKGYSLWSKLFLIILLSSILYVFYLDYRIGVSQKATQPTIVGNAKTNESCMLKSTSYREGGFFKLEIEDEGD